MLDMYQCNTPKPTNTYGDEERCIQAVLTQYLQRVTDGQTDGQTDVQPIAITCVSVLMHVKNG